MGYITLTCSICGMSFSGNDTPYFRAIVDAHISSGIPGNHQTWSSEFETYIFETYVIQHPEIAATQWYYEYYSSHSSYPNAPPPTWEPPPPPPPPTDVVVSFYTLREDLLGSSPKGNAGSDLRRTITVNGQSLTTPFTMNLQIGSTVNLRSAGSRIWDYYGVGHAEGEEVSYSINGWATEIAAFFEAPPPTKYVEIQAATGGETEPCAGRYVLEQTTMVTAIPGPGFLFDHWILDGMEMSQNPITVSPTQSHVLAPRFQSTTEPPVNGGYVPQVNHTAAIVGSVIAGFITIVVASKVLKKK